MASQQVLLLIFIFLLILFLILILLFIFLSFCHRSHLYAKRSYVKRWLVWTCFLLLWTILLLLPGKSFDAIGPQPLGIDRHLLQKSLHVVAYALFAVLSGWLLVPARSRWLLLFFVVTHGTMTELLQGFVPGRSSSLTDVGLDNLGVLLGLLLSWKWWARP